MPQPLAPESPVWATPRFYVTPDHRFNPGPFFLALVIAVGCLFAVLYALTHSGRAHRFANGSGSSQRGKGGSASGATEDDDDPSTVDTIYLGDPAEAPVATRPASRPGAVHPFVLVHLPRSGSQVGQIPDTPAGRLLYGWLAAFNSTDHSAAARALSTTEPAQAELAQMELRRQTRGFTLVSAREVQSGVLVFRLHDQTAAATEVLGTLQVRPNSSPPSIASFSLNAVPTTQVSVH